MIMDAEPDCLHFWNRWMYIIDFYFVASTIFFYICVLVVRGHSFIFYNLMPLASRAAFLASVSRSLASNSSNSRAEDWTDCCLIRGRRSEEGVS